MKQTRREFLEFLGHSAIASTFLHSPLSSFANPVSDPFSFAPLKPRKDDLLTLVPGLNAQVLLSFGDTINTKGDQFGFDSDFTAFIPTKPGITDEGFLWVNHESTHPLYVKSFNEQQKSVGGTLVVIKKTNGQWRIVKNDPRNRRFDAQTEIPFIGGKVADKDHCIGTLANCGGGVTPWNTFLTCEENYDHYYGEVKFEDGKRSLNMSGAKFGWEKHVQHPPEHYGWVTEINPFDGSAKKLLSLGRFAHEGAMVVSASDGRLAVYMGDDAKDQCLYKFISNKAGSLETGILYVANLESKKWIPLVREQNKLLKSKFRDQTELLIRTREAAHTVGGTKLDRPEDIKYDAITKSIVVSLTNNLPKGNYFGSLLRVKDKNGDPLSLDFDFSTFVSGGPETGLSCPDNLMFDPKGNLWVTNDIAGLEINKPPYTPFGNNGLYVVPASGPHAGKVIQVASAPMDAELAGPFLSPDKKTIFLSVQHPGELSKSLDQLTSHWPNGGKMIPRPSVVALSGPLLDKIMA